MSAYVIVEIDILDPAGYEEYKKLASATVEKYGGKYIVRGGRTEVLEGDWDPKRIVVLVSWEKNDRRDHRHHSDPFCHRTPARQPPDFYRTGMDQRLLAASTRSRPAPLADPHFPARHRHHSHLRDDPAGN